MKRSSQPRVAVELSKSVSHRLNTYALAAGAAGVGLLTLSQPADAKIIYTPAHIKYPYSLDLNHDGIIDFRLPAFGGNGGPIVWQVCQYVVSGSLSGCNSLGTNAIRVHPGTDLAAALRYGKKIKGGDPFVRIAVLGTAQYSTYGSFTHWGGLWLNNGKGVKNRYLGLKFKIKGKFHFGWARLTVKVAHNSCLSGCRPRGPAWTSILTGYAYETIPGKGIVAGKTKGPDVITVSPASLGHLAAGAAAIPAWRVKQTTATTH